MNVFDKIHDLCNFPHKFATEWKEKKDRQVFGCVCTNIPEELIYAAGILPVRLLGTNEPENVTEPYIFRGGFCEFCRDCFAQILLGRYDYVNGVVFGTCCFHAREIFQGWQNQKPNSYSYEMYLPYNLQEGNTVEVVANEIADFKHSLENWIRSKITDEDIDNAVNVYNLNRTLMMEVYEHMKSDNPPLTSLELAEIELSGLFIDKQVHNGLLKELLKELPNRKRPKGHDVRIMLLGSVNNDLEIMKLFDKVGACVVTNDYCTGKRYYDLEVIPRKKRLEALAERLVNKTPCPLQDLPERRRIRHIGQEVDNFKVDGVIYTLQGLCDSHGIDYPTVEALCTKKGIPILKLELDSGSANAQLRTRIEAFIEMISIEIP